MAKPWEIARLWGTAVLNGWSIVFTLSGLVVLFAGGLLGPQTGTRFATILAAVDPYRWYAALVLFIGAAYVATYKAVNRFERDFYTRKPQRSGRPGIPRLQSAS